MEQLQQPPAVCQLSVLTLAASPLTRRSGGSEKVLLAKRPQLVSARTGTGVRWSYSEGGPFPWYLSVRTRKVHVGGTTESQVCTQPSLGKMSVVPSTPSWLPSQARIPHG